MIQNISQTFIDGKPQGKVVIQCVVKDPEGKDPTAAAHAIEVDDFKNIKRDLARARRETLKEMEAGHSALGDFLKKQS